MRISGKTPVIATVLAIFLLLPACKQSAAPESAPTEPPSSEAASPPPARDAETPAEISFFAMDTYMQLKAYGEEADAAVAAMQDEIMYLDGLFTHTGTESDVTRINGNAGTAVPVAEDMMKILRRTGEMSALTGGVLDITVHPIVAGYGFPTGDYHVLSPDERAELLAYVDYKSVLLNETAGTAQLERAGMAISLGAVAKGYASNRAAEICGDMGITSALIALGGNIHALGAKPDGSLWRVAVQDPFSDADYAGVLAVEDCAVITSGGYQRYFDIEENGETVRYHHIIDPSSGLPAKSGLESVTIITRDGVLGEALSTALFVMGLDGASEFWRETGGFEAVFITDSGEAHITAGLAKSYSPLGNYGNPIVIAG